MHKRLVNHCTIELTIKPEGPILIKSGKEGADPAKPDMEFVETYSNRGKTIYLPGSSLKGALRAHAERIVRTVGSATRPSNPTSPALWASDPLKREDDAERYFKDQKVKDSQEIYRRSCFIGQLFGNTAIASRLRIEDAYPSGEIKLEERNGVAIDRIFGSVAVGPFNYQVCTQGQFKTKIHLKNFTLAQLGLLALVLRDLNDGWFGLGFAKSRGMGTVSLLYDQALVQYPGCVLKEGRIARLGSEQTWAKDQLLGAGMFLTGEELTKYGFPSNDVRSVTGAETRTMDYGFGVELAWASDAIKEGFFTPTVAAWAKVLEAAAV
jgi:CRISPR-associated RAMP protein (TIGR02581 family)